MVYTYLAGHVGRVGEQGAFRALARGYTHWVSSVRSSNNPNHCHVWVAIKPSMKDGLYRVYVLIGCDGDVAVICCATCECVAG